MKIIRRKSDNVVSYLVDDTATISLSQNLTIRKANGDVIRARGVNNSDYEIVTGVMNLPNFVGGQAKYVDGLWEDLSGNQASLGTKITKLALRNRFTFAERVAIETAKASSAELRVLLDDLSVALFIDLSRPDTIAGINRLATATLITEARASEILTDPVTEDELFTYA